MVEHSFATARASNSCVLSLGISSLNLGRWPTSGSFFVRARALVFWPVENLPKTLFCEAD
jgi:hypothetical protein